MREKGRGGKLREHLDGVKAAAFMGAYDVFSATLAGQSFDGVFLSGFGLSASRYGLPDEGFISWPDMVSFAERARGVLDGHHIIADMDDGYGDAKVAARVAVSLERAGVSGVVMEDQRRPRKCGHLDGKRLLSIDEYVKKLKAVLDARDDLFVIARTDASSEKEILRRVRAYSRAGADAVLVDALKSKALVRKVAAATDCRVAFNQISGGKSPSLKLDELRRLGVSIVIYSTPCLFAAHGAIQKTLDEMKRNGGLLPSPGPGVVDLRVCGDLLNANLPGAKK